MHARLALLTVALAALFLAPTLGCAVEEPAEDVPVEEEGAWMFEAEPEVHPVTAALVAEHGSVQPRGATKIGVHLEIEPGWHIYAQHPGDAGLPTAIVWDKAPHVTFGPLVWPPPEPHVDPGNIRTNGYSGSAVIYAPVQVSRKATPGETLPIRAKVEWLACQEICIPGTAELSLALPVVAGAPPRSAHAQLFDQVTE